MIIYKDNGRMTVTSTVDTENVGFSIINYPDGQRSIKLHLDELNKKTPINIKCRIKTFSDLEILLSIVAALEKNDFVLESIEFVYLFGMRSDRAFNEGEPNYFRDVLAPILNEIPCIKIIHHPHSEISMNTLTYKLDQYTNCRHQLKSDCFVIAADAGSLNATGYLARFDKFRKNGALQVIMDEDNFKKLSDHIKKHPDYPVLIEDDLLDGGATFIQEALWLKKHFPATKRYLAVTHAIFSNGINQVAVHFEAIYCTNSYQDINHPKVIQMKVI